MPFDKATYMKEYNKNYRSENRLKCLSATQKWREENANHVKSYRDEYRLKHKEYFKKKMAEWTSDNREKVNESHRAWRNSNKNLVALLSKGYKKRFFEKHPFKIKQYGVYGRTGEHISYDLIQSVYEDNIKKYGTLTCYLCFDAVEFGKDSLEHKTPSKRGGDNSKSNLGVAHIMCNTLKGNLTEKEYRKKISTVLV